MIRPLAPELQNVYNTLISEGYEVYTYTCSSNQEEEIDALFWYENHRVLSIQASSWRSALYARDLFNLYTEYWPSVESGSGCLLSGDSYGTSANQLLHYRKEYTWIEHTPYASMDDFLKCKKVLKFHKIGIDGG